MYDLQLNFYSKTPCSYLRLESNVLVLATSVLQTSLIIIIIITIYFIFFLFFGVNIKEKCYYYYYYYYYYKSRQKEPTYPCINRPLETMPSCQVWLTVCCASRLSPKLQSRRTALASFDSALSTVLVVLADVLVSASDAWCWNRLAWIRVSSTSTSPVTSTKLLGYRNLVPAVQTTESECKCLTCNQKPTGNQCSLLHEPN